MAGHLLYGYKLNERGRIVHKMFDSDDLLHGFGKQEGWVDSPDKVPGAKKALAAEAAVKAATANTVGMEPKVTGPVYGEVKRKPGRPRKNP
jgi:hypothetical protein